MDWRLVLDYLIRRPSVYLIISPIGITAGYFKWYPYFLPFLFMFTVIESIDDFFRLKPHRIIQTLGVSKGTVFRHLWFETSIFPALFFALSFWIGAIAESKSLPIGKDDFQILIVSVLWLLIFQSVGLIFCLFCGREPVSRLFVLTVILLGFFLAGTQSIQKPGIGWLIAATVILLVSSLVFLELYPSKTVLFTTERREKPLFASHAGSTLLLRDRAFSHPHWSLCFAIVGTALFGVSYRLTRSIFPSSEWEIIDANELTTMASTFILLSVPIVVPMFLLQRWRSAIRVFRSLPISTDGLLVQILVLNGLLSLVYCVLMVLFAEIPLPGSLFGQVTTCFMMIVVATSLFAAVAASSASPDVMSLFWGGLLGPTMFFFGVKLRSEGGISVVLGTLAGLIFLIAASLIIRRGIQDNSDLYRADAAREA